MDDELKIATKTEPKELEEQLGRAATELDKCAYLINKLQFEPVKENMLVIGNALADIGDLQTQFSSFRERLTKPGPNTCNFCKKEESDAELLIQGPQVFICNECVATCEGMVKEKYPSKLDLHNY